MASSIPLSIDDRLKQTVPFELTVGLGQLQTGDQKALELCLSAARTIDELYLEQVYEGNSSLLEGVRKDTGQERTKLSRYLSIHGGPWDRWQKNEPFVDGIGPKAPGANFYPADMSIAEWENYLRANPREADALRNPYTVIRRVRNKLQPIFFHEVWASRLKSASGQLRAASELCTDAKLREFLRLRADALLTDEYAESDAAWIEVDGSPIEITIGPYEVYEDSLLNLKACYEAALVVRDEVLSKNAKEFSACIEEFDARLAQRLNYVPHGNKTPMVVGDLYFGAGHLSHHGFQTMAYNLPNDERTKARYGSKKVFLKNVMYGKFEMFTKPIAERLFVPTSLTGISRDALVTFILGHEIAHGMGPEIIRQDGSTVSVKRYLGNLYSLLEEAKADVLGLVYLAFLARQGMIAADSVRAASLTHLADIFRTLRFGPHEDHARGVLIQYNWLRRDGIITYDARLAKFDVRDELIESSHERLADAIMTVQRAGDYQQAQDFVKRWSIVPEELDAAAQTVRDLPIDLEPIFNIQ